MKEIGKIMKLTEGRVCQLHTQALIRLKAKISQELSAKEG
jgi:RNA polymerase sigma factor for flagellar operon FliA